MFNGLEKKNQEADQRGENLSSAMENSSKIPRRTDDTKGPYQEEMDSDKERKEKQRKLSLTGQGKAAKLLRKRLAFALATNSKMKSDSGTSASEASDTETTGKGLITKEERKSSITRNNPQKNTKNLLQTEQLQEKTTERSEETVRAERNKRIAIVSSLNDAKIIGNKQRANEHLMKQEETTNSAFGSAIREVDVSNNTSAETLLREPTNRDGSVSTAHEHAPSFSEGSMVLQSLAYVERQLPQLAADVNATLTDFLNISKDVERVKMKFHELKNQRTNYGA